MTGIMNPELEQEIATVAREVFRRHGPKAPARLVARELGMSATNLLARVGSKERLLLLAYGDAESSVLEDLEAGVKLGKPARDQLYELLLDLNTELERKIERAMRIGKEAPPPPANEHWPLVTRKLLARWLAQAGAHKALEVRDASLTAQVLIGTLESRVITSCLTRKQQSPQQNRVFIRGLIRLLFPRL